MWGLGILTLNDNTEGLMSEKITRREVIKRAAYITPVILTLTAVPAFASGGSGRAGEGSSWSDKKYRNKTNSWSHKKIQKKP